MLWSIERNEGQGREKWRQKTENGENGTEGLFIDQYPF